MKEKFSSYQTIYKNTKNVFLNIFQEIKVT